MSFNPTYIPPGTAQRVGDPQAQSLTIGGQQVPGYVTTWQSTGADGTNQTGLAKLPNHIGIHKENFEDIKDKDKTIDILCPCSLSPDNTKLVFKAVAIVIVLIGVESVAAGEV